MAGPSKDSFASILRPTLRSDITSFVSSIYASAKLTEGNGFFSLFQRLAVTTIGINKAGFPSEHESLSVWAVDKLTLEKHEYVIERGPSKNTYASRFATFSQCPDSSSVMESIQRAIRNIG
jgi:hypothetical protein